MEYLFDVDSEKLKKQWKELVNFDFEKNFSDNLLRELFSCQEKLIYYSIGLVTSSIAHRKELSSKRKEEVTKRTDQIEVALGQFSFLTMYSNFESRRYHLEKEMDNLLRDLHSEELLAWKDLHNLYKELFYLMYKGRTLETVKRITEANPNK